MEENKTGTQEVEQQDVQPFATWMDQAVYDRNGNGIVDDAEKLNGKVEGDLNVANAATAATLNGKTESDLVVSYAMNAGSAASAATATSANTAASATHAVNANIAASATVATTAENALKLGDKVENQLEVASAQTAGYATNAGTALAAGDAEKLGGVLPSQFMLKAVYDQNGNGIVDNAENAQLLGGKPEGELEVASAQTAATADYAANAGTALAAGDAEKLGGVEASVYLRKDEEYPEIGDKTTFEAINEVNNAVSVAQAGVDKALSGGFFRVGFASNFSRSYSGYMDYQIPFDTVKDNDFGEDLRESYFIRVPAGFKYATIKGFLGMSTNVTNTSIQISVRKNQGNVISMKYYIPSGSADAVPPLDATGTIKVSEGDKIDLIIRPIANSTMTFYTGSFLEVYFHN